MPLDDNTELFYHVDEHDQVLGSITRAEAHADRNLIHRAIDVLVFNTQDQVLLQKRSQHKDLYPHFWTVSVGGHVTFGESYEASASREMQEELGISAKLTFVTKILLVSQREQEFSTIFSAKFDSLPTQFDRTEIAELRWVSIAKLPEFAKQEQLTPNCLTVFKEMGYLK